MLDSLVFQEKLKEDLMVTEKVNSWPWMASAWQSGRGPGTWKPEKSCFLLLQPFALSLLKYENAEKYMSLH